VQVILMERIPHLGDLGAKVKVKPGFARNFLVPLGKAVPATEENLKVFEARRAELEKAANERLQAAEQRVSSLSGLIVTIPANAGEEGRLFGSIGTLEISKAITDAGQTVAKHEVKLPQGPIRQVGEYELDLHLHGSDVIAKIKISVVPE